MSAALKDLRLERLDVIHGGDFSFPPAERIDAVSLERFLTDVCPLT